MPFTTVQQFVKAFPAVKGMDLDMQKKCLSIFNAMKKENPDMDDGKAIATAISQVKKAKDEKMEDHFNYVSLLSNEELAEVEVLRTGMVFDRGLEITEKMLDDMVKHYEENVYGQELPVNQEHRRGSEAMGWFKGLYRKGKSLMAKIDWTKLGTQKIKDNIFKFISVEFGDVPHHQTGKIIKNVLLGAGLTNTPAMKDQTALTAFSEQAQIYINNQNTMNELKTLFDELMSNTELSEENVKTFKESEHFDAENEDAKNMLSMLEEKAKMLEEIKNKEEELKKRDEKISELEEEGKEKNELVERVQKTEAKNKELEEKIELTELKEEVKNDYCLSDERHTGIKGDEESVKKLSKFIQGLSQDQRKEFKELFDAIRTVDLSEKGDLSSPEAKTEAIKLDEANKEAQKRFSEDKSKGLEDHLSDVYKEMGLV